MKQFLKDVSDYVITFLGETLSPELHFHNVNHTLEVVEAAKEIGSNCSLTEDEMKILLTAAWFHDCGYSHIYTGHEEESKKIADSFLRNLGCSQTFIDSVKDAIDATRFPQYPKNLIQEVLCDADLYHFTRPGYPKYAKAIRREFDIFLGKAYSDDDWKSINCKMLASHAYFTPYGKDILARFKEANIRLMNCAE